MALLTVVALGLGPGNAGPAWALADWVGVEAAGMQNTPDGTAAIEDNGIPGTTFDYQDTLGIEDDDVSPMARLWFRLGKKNHLSFDYFNPKHGGEAVLTQPLVFSGTTFNAGETLTTGMELELVQARYRYHFVDLKVFEFGLGVGVNQATLHMELDGSTTGSETLDEKVPFPTLAAALVFKPLPGLHIRVEGDGISASSGSDNADFLDYRAQIEWYFLHFFGVFGGYRSVHFDVESDDFGKAELDYAGPYAGLGVKF